MTSERLMLDWSKSFMYNIHQTHFLIEKHLEQKLSEAHSISFSQFLVLIPLKCHPHASQTDIAEALYLTEATVSRHVSALAEEGLLTRIEDPENRRKHILTLTEKGSKQFLRAQKIIETVLHETFSEIPNDQRSIVSEVFHKITTKLITKI